MKVCAYMVSTYECAVVVCIEMVFTYVAILAIFTLVAIPAAFAYVTIPSVCIYAISAQPDAFISLKHCARTIKEKGCFWYQLGSGTKWSGFDPF